MLTPDAVNYFFSIAPWVIFIALIVATYLTARNAARSHAPIGKTYACAQCGRRGKHEHMVPMSREGAVVWYCARCAH
jgi:hypothetical protein